MQGGGGGEEDDEVVETEAEPLQVFCCCQIRILNLKIQILNVKYQMCGGTNDV